MPSSSNAIRFKAGDAVMSASAGVYSPSLSSCSSWGSPSENDEAILLPSPYELLLSEDLRKALSLSWSAGTMHIPTTYDLLPAMVDPQQRALVLKSSAFLDDILICLQKTERQITVGHVLHAVRNGVVKPSFLPAGGGVDVDGKARLKAFAPKHGDMLCSNVRSLYSEHGVPTLHVRINHYV